MRQRLPVTLLNVVAGRPVGRAVFPCNFPAYFSRGAAAGDNDPRTRESFI